MLTNVLAIPEKSVAMYARHLREARLISTGGRGPGGAEMSPKNCANLLLAILGAKHVKDAAKAVKQFRRMIPQDHPTAWTLEDLNLPALTKLPENHRFGRALDALIIAAMDSTLEAALQAVGRKYAGGPIMVSGHLELIVRSPSSMAKIEFRGHGWSEHVTYSKRMPWGYRTPSREELKDWAKEFEKTGDHGDLMQDRRITARTILALGEFLRA